jgi:hypothetical protein
MDSINFLRTGWEELHNSAMIFGAEVDYWRFEDYPELKNRRYLDAQLYSTLLPRIVKQSKINLETYGCRSDLILNLIFRRMRKDAKNHDNFSWWYYLTTEKSVNTLLHDFQNSSLNFHNSQAPVFSKIQIHTIAKYGMWLINLETEDPKQDLLAMLWGLALIGVTKYLWDKQGVCEFCYRRTWPGRRFCEEHSQSQSDVANRSKNYMNYRAGKRTHVLIKELKLVEKIHGDILLRQATSVTAMCDLLFPEYMDEEVKADEKDMIFHALSQSPLVVERLKLKLREEYADFINMDYELLINHLRKVLDPYELSGKGWVLKIFSAEIWFEMERKANPGVRKSGKKATARIAAAKKLAALGFKKSEIACKLKISPSTISKWISRKPEISGFYVDTS